MRSLHALHIKFAATDLTCSDGERLVSSLPGFDDFSLVNNQNQNQVDNLFVSFFEKNKTTY